MAGSKPRSISRRSFASLLGTGVAGAIVAPTIWIPRTAHAADKIKSIKRGKTGTTIELALDHGPFPATGERYTDNTCFIYVPHHYRMLSDNKIDAVLHFHGHSNTAAGAMTTYKLREQLSDSKQNAILIVPQGPVKAKDSSGGKLEKQGALNTFLREVRELVQSNEVAAKLGKASIPKSARVGMLCVSAHSGGYHVAAKVCQHGGFDVREVYLFDALYGDMPIFRDWVVAKKSEHGQKFRHKLISFYGKGAKVKDLNLKLMAEFDRRGIKYEHETKPGQLTRKEMTLARAVFIHAASSHARLQWKHNNLRDCLYASALRRLKKSDWFDNKDDPRAIDTRAG